MNINIHYSQIPQNYLLCLKHDCPRATTCLRQIAEQIVPADIQFWAIISPKYQATLQGTCPFYRSSAKVRFAKGFIKMLENLPHKQMRTVISHLTNYFGRRTYYRVRKGERLLSPAEQKGVLNILKNCGVTHLQDFDAYTEETNW